VIFSLKPGTLSLGWAVVVIIVVLIVVVVVVLVVVLIVVVVVVIVVSQYLQRFTSISVATGCKTQSVSVPCTPTWFVS
jgi:hypothetical protein